MTYEKEREIKISIIGEIQNWTEEHGLETSSEDDVSLAHRIFDKLKSNFK